VQNLSGEKMALLIGFVKYFLLKYLNSAIEGINCKGGVMCVFVT
jgi:hypothetical protein